jgi:uncharacterized protein YegP (UPF0339 family)
MMEAPKNSFDSLDKQDIQLAGTATSAPYGLPDTNTSLHGLALPIGLDTQKSGQIKAELISTALLTSYEPDTLVPVPFLPSQADPITGSTKLSLASLADPIIGSAIDDFAANITTTGSLSVGGSRTGIVNSSGDRDWFRISLNAGRTYRFNLNGSTLSDPTLHLRNASGISLAFNDDFSGLNSQITFTATTSGIYFLDAGAYSSGTGSYTLAATEFHPDDFAANNATTGSLSVGGSSTGVVNSSGDRDWFRISLNAGSTYRFNLNGSTLSDPTLHLRNVSGISLAFNDDFSGLNSQITFTATTSGIYYLDAGAYSSGTGSYTLAATDLTPVDDFAANTATTGSLSVGGSRTGVVNSSGDRDWFRISLNAGITYRFNLNGNTLSDPTLHLRNASGVSLAFNDNFSGLNSQITFTATTSGTYYLDAGGSLSSQGSYNISFLDTTPSSDRISGLFDANLRSSINIALQDNLFSLSELANLLRITGNDGTVSAVEFADLRTINANLSRWLSPSTNSYYSYIFNAAVNGNTANQWWTAGGGTRTALGNLQAGSSALQLNRLVDKWFGGLDLPTNFVGGDTARSAGALTFSYSTATGTLFQNGISFSDIAQGQAGTCYLLAAASSLANNQSGLISDLFRDNGDGTFGVRFYSSSRNEFWVTVNRALPTLGGSLVLAGNSSRSLNGELWVALLEKAYAQANETGLFGRSTTANSFSYVEGGWEDALTHLSGATTSSVSAYYTSSRWQSAVNNLTTWNTLRNNAIAAFNAGRSLWVGSFGNTTGSNGKTNLVSGHAFAVTGFNAATGNFILANPWGSTARSWNHQFEVTWQQLFNARAVVSWDNGNPPIRSV